MTRSDADGVGHDPEVPVARHRVERLRGLPSSRALVGGLLVALAGVGTLVAWQRAAGSPEHAYAVAAHPILPGETLSPEDVRLVPIDLPGGVAAAAFTDARSVAERVALGPIGEGELVQLSEVSDPGGAEATAEVSLALDRDRAVDGRLRSGDVVDVFATYDDRTEAVVERVRVVGVTDAGGASFTSGSQVTVTLALTDASRRAPVIHAARVGEVTLVRSTHLPASTAPAPSASTGPNSPAPPVSPAAPAGPAGPAGSADGGESDGPTTSATPRGGDE